MGVEMKVFFRSNAKELKGQKKFVGYTPHRGRALSGRGMNRGKSSRPACPPKLHFQILSLAIPHPTTFSRCFMVFSPGKLTLSIIALLFSECGI